MNVYRLAGSGWICGREANPPACVILTSGRMPGHAAARIRVASCARRHPREPHMAEKTGTTTQAATSGVTKQEAVRRALAALGKTATASAIQKYVKDTFSLAMT